VLKGGVWYLVAQSGKAVRTYRIAAIEEAEISSQTFVRPKNFDLASHWEKSSRAYEEGLYRETADIKLSPKGFRLLGLLGSHVAEGAQKSRRKPDRHGWIRCTIPVESVAYGVRELMRLGPEVEVLGPPALRAKLKEALAEMLERHRA
jgi:predicted DNA-binding transcriptional regulator YafY